MRFITFFSLWLAAATTILGQQYSSQGEVLEVYSGAELARALAEASGPETLLIATDYAQLTEADFAGLEVPIVLNRSRTICGRQDRWAVWNTTRTRNKLRLTNNVTLTLRWLIVFDTFGDVSSGANADFLMNMPENETGTFFLEHTAYLTPFCYPPTMTDSFLGASKVRPPGFPGQNTYNATASIPAALMAMGGGLEGASAVSADGVVCSNDTRGPPMRRCWGHVAHLINFAVRGGAFDANRVFSPTGYVGYILDTYMLCSVLLDEACIEKYTPYGCLQTLIKAAASPGSSDSGGGSDGTDSGSGVVLAGNDTAAAIPPPKVGGSAAPSPSRSTKSGSGALVGGIVGGVLAAVLAAALVFVVVRQWRRRRRDAARKPPLYGSRLVDYMAGDGSCSDGSPVDDGYGSMPRGNVTTAGGGFVSSAGVASVGAASVGAKSAAGRTASSDKVTHNSSDCENESGLAGRPSRTGPGPPSLPSSGLPSGLDLDSSPQDAKRGRRSPVGQSASAQAQQQQQQQEEQQEQNGGQQEGGGGGAPGRDVVVTPFTPLRPDLQLWQDPEQRVTLLPVVRGKGSYGKVCEGLYGGQRVAVKLVRDMLVGGSLSANDKIVTTFAQEVEVLGRCQHPNVVRLLAACMQPPRFCLVMELMETSLQRLVFGQSPCRLLPLSKVLHIGCEIARALEYLHPTIVHRDLKPDNVLISNTDSAEPIVKVSDFGLSRLRCTVSPTMQPEAGTPSYMAPECFDLYVSCITHHVDIYSWAVIMWTMLSGIEPWTGCGVVEIAYRVTLLDERLLLNDCVASGRCPARLQRLLSRCWSRIPERRPAAAEVVKEMLLIMQQQERSAVNVDLEANYMASPGSVLNRIREYQDAAAAATTAAAAPIDGTGAAAAAPDAAAAAATAAPAPAAVAAADTVDADAGVHGAASAGAAAPPPLAATVVACAPFATDATTGQAESEATSCSRTAWASAESKAAHG